MRFFGWFQRQPEQNEARFSSSRRWAWLAGRRVLTNTPYVMPKDKAEGDRLDIRQGYFTEERYAALLSQAERELPQTGVNLPVRFVFGQKW